MIINPEVANGKNEKVVTVTDNGRKVDVLYLNGSASILKNVNPVIESLEAPGLTATMRVPEPMLSKLLSTRLPEPADETPLTEILFDNNPKSIRADSINAKRVSFLAGKNTIIAASVVYEQR